MNSKVEAREVEKKFSPPLFLFTIAMTFTIIMGIVFAILRLCGLDGVLHAQLYWERSKVLIVFLVFQGISCYGEWFFHRYMLHAPMIPGFSRLYVQHDTIHHSLTILVPLPKNRPEQEWRNNYPIVHERQFRASYFPWYSYAGFTAFAMLFIVPIQALLPSWPVLIVSVLSLGWSLVMYEIIHAIEHLPLPWWQGKFDLPIVGGLIKRLYAFHLMHHEVTTGYGWNMNISGYLCGLPLADLTLRTLRFPKVVFGNGTSVAKNDLRHAIPRFGILRWLDSLAARSVKKFKLA